MEWFVEAVIGAELFRNEHPSAPPLTFENIRIDSTSTVMIDISTLSKFFLDTHRTLVDQKRLIPPLDYKETTLVYSRIMVALVEHFVASGDLILKNPSPTDHFQYFELVIHKFLEQHHLMGITLPGVIGQLFVYEIQSPSAQDFFIPTQNSFLCGNQVEHSDQFLDAVRQVKEKHSMEVVIKLYFDWKEWVTMMEMVEKGETTLILPSSNLSVSDEHSKVSKRSINTLPCRHKNEESRDTESSSEDLNSEHPRLPFLFNNSIHSSSTISADIHLPSQHSSSSSVHQLLSSPPPPHLNQLPSQEASRIHSYQILSVLHSFLSQSQINTYPWKLRFYSSPEQDQELITADLQTPVCLDERFGPSLFDEPDDIKMIQSLIRCRHVVQETQSIQCIDDLDNFLGPLIGGLNTSSQGTRTYCFNLFIEIIKFLPFFDPRADQFRTLRNAFQAKSKTEQKALLYLWRVWLSSRTIDRNEPKMCLKDFDFKGFQTANLSHSDLFSEACQFVIALFSSANALISNQWRFDFILHFEKKNHVLDRLADDPGPWSNHNPTTLHLTPPHVVFATFMSIFHGYDFHTTLTELITIDLHSSPHRILTSVNPIFYLNHTSIAPKHRRSFIPMDLIFERYLRDRPIAFFRHTPVLGVRSVRRFLVTPFVGLHSLLLRCPQLSLDEHTLHHLILMFMANRSSQDATQTEINTLFAYYPPPRLIDTLLTPPHLVRENFSIRRDFLHVVAGFGVFTSPFGACSSLGKVFKILIPFDSNPEEFEMGLQSKVGDIVVSLHWLNIPAHFDSPLICHLPALNSAQRGILQTLSSYSGIVSLVIPHTSLFINESSFHIVSQGDDLNHRLILTSVYLRFLAFSEMHEFLLSLHGALQFSSYLLSPFPTLVSAAFEFFHRLVSVLSDADRIKLAERGLLDHVMFAVSNSSFLDDYEKGVAVIGMILDTIRREDQKRRMMDFDFYRVVKRIKSPTCPDERAML
ncbi:hypothetical protein BLNAU_4849 [Blattamonas nauphoetae]|uniref:Uncharacterized protein n=1 Tax=Blattamonas nauphoetae TaxID=2049346 RepID=A0ABQ9Y940_9EUKA|nr:hypothetical protein BLNAU_4849 [Blattamonas nauphoetae]